MNTLIRKTTLRFSKHGGSQCRCLLYGLFLLLLGGALSAQAQRQMENLGRGVVAVRSASSQAFVSWRLLALDPAGIGFNVYRSVNGGAAVKLNTAVLTNGCNYTDTPPSMAQTNAYHVRPVIGGVEQAASAAWSLPPNAEIGPLFRIPLQIPPNRYVYYVWVGDLDGDGEYEFVVAWAGSVLGQTQKLQAYKRDGTLLWTVDFGPNSVDPDGVYPNAAAMCAAGQWDGVTVYDLDGDGRAEVIVKSASGVTFGNGATLSFGDNVTQFLSVLDGMTGAERARTLLPNPWKDDDGFPLGTIFGIGYCDGVRPSLLIHAKNRTGGSGTPFNTIESAWDFRGGVLSNRWSIQWNGANAPTASHQVRIIDVNGDGKDELIPGMHAVSSSGALLYDQAGLGVKHGDRFFISDLNPNRPGLEGYAIQQNNPSGLIEYLFDAATGQLIWTNSVLPTEDAGRGSAIDIDPRYPGAECWSFYGIHAAADGTIISPNPTRPYPNSTTWWDGDLLGDNLNETVVDKWNYAAGTTTRLLSAYHYGATDNTGKLPPIWGDILGDWREELVYQDTNSSLVVFTTSSATTNRLYTLAQNPAYRNCLTVHGYMQSKMPDYFLGYGMSNPPAPNIVYVTNTMPPAAPSAPSGLTAVAVSDSQINLAWTDNSSNEEAFQIERSTNGVNFVQVNLAGANATNHQDSALTSGVTFYYRIRASNLGGNSAYTSVANATTVTPTQMVKADTATMNTAADWSGGTPSLAEIGLFNNVLGAGNAAALSLGDNVSVGGLTFAGNMAGPVTVGAGNTLTLGGAGVDMSLANQNVTFHPAMALASNQVWNVAGGRTLTVNGSFTGAGFTVTKSGSGTVALGSSANDAGAKIQVNSGVVQANINNGITIALNGGTFNVNVAAGNPINVMLGGGIEQNIGGNRTWSGNLMGSGPLTVVASATHTWSGNNAAYDGTITLQGGGYLRLNSTNAVSTGTAYNFNGGRMVANASGLFQLGSLSGFGAITNNAGQNFSIGARDEDTTFSGTIVGAGYIAKAGSGTMILTGTNTYTGGTIINSGTLQIGDNGTTGVPGPGNITNNATLVFNRANALNDSAFGGISGSGTVVQAGDGVLTLTNAHTYTGPTFIEAGTLALTESGAIAGSASILVAADALLDVSGRTGGGMILASGKTLRGLGAVKGDFTIGSGARLQPGDSIGTLTFSNALVLVAGSTNVFEISSDSLAGDQVRVLGNLTCGGTLIVTNIGSSTLTAGDSFELFDAASFSGTFGALVLPPLPNGLLWMTSTLATDGTLVVVSVAPPVINSAEVLGNGAFRLNFSGTTGQAYEVRATTNLLVTPITSWMLLSSGTFNGGAVVFDDLQATNSPQRFYRIRIP